MNLKASFLFAKRIIFPKSGRSSIARKSLEGAILCVGISLIPLVVVLAVSSGMIDGVTRRMISLSSSHLEAFSVGGDSSLLKDAAAQALNVPGVTFSYPMIEASALATANSKRCGVSVRALPPEIFSSLKSYKELFYAEDGSVEDFVSGQKSVMIGRGVADKLGVAAGDTIRLVTIHKKDGGVSPSIHSYKVSALVSCGYRELDAMWLFIPFDVGKRILKGSDISASVKCELENPFSPQVYSAQKALKRALGQKFKVFRWDQLNASQYENFSSTKILLIFIQLLVVLVASVNISSALTMLALERRREIGILKSLGASPKGISLAFLMAGFFCAFSGLLFGIPAGLFLSVNINSVIKLAEKAVNFFGGGLYFLFKGDIMAFEQIHLLDDEYYLNVIPIDIPFGDLFLIGTSALILSLAASLWPALKAGKERPLETLRDSR